ncbi:hypothetical protein BN2476_210046 [Paraburkholderia piptadeniae]|uniref:Uncharacterized protein n=1 Tax=Paraburkholderia piptadeniae TaxID=1701573 RepID=A0A1N7RVI4_9BURK|nr:hypothetical protein BN2476_210046 [Paraburkholderia piptadeniae]
MWLDDAFRPPQGIPSILSKFLDRIFTRCEHPLNHILNVSSYFIGFKETDGESPEAQ